MEGVCIEGVWIEGVCIAGVVMEGVAILNPDIFRKKSLAEKEVKKLILLNKIQPLFILFWKFVA